MARRCPGFTLIEVLVVLAIVGFMVSLLLPAVQGAREAARRARCTNNLKQLALAAAAYEHQVGCYPMGNPIKPDLLYSVAVLDGHGVFVALLPFLEQPALFDRFNFDRSVFYSDNATAIATRVDIFSCPGDHNAGGPKTAPFQLYGADEQATTNIASYAGNSGLVHRYPASVAEIANMPNHNKQCDGLFFVNSRVRLTDVRDGSSNTLLFGERSHSRLTLTDPDYYHWWVSGWMCDTLFITCFQINPPPGSGSGNHGPELWGASSPHAGGANFAMCDGSARFIKDTVDSVPAGSNGFPIGYEGDFIEGVTFPPGTRFGVYQALGSRAGGEVIGPGGE